ncbi:hypothetical protein SUDANB6_05709 [Streptomyces sp. enrichment culture]
MVECDRIGLAEVPAAEAAAPVRSPDAVAHNLRERFGARCVSFLFVGVLGRRLLRVHEEEAAPQEHGADRMPLAGRVYDGYCAPRDRCRYRMAHRSSG